MIILIENIPQHTTEKNIRKFVTPALKKLGIIRLGNIQKIDILGIVNKKSGSVRYASLVRINTEISVETVIQKLNQKPFESEIVTVKEYKIRTVHNDPRYRYLRDDMNNKRVADRRVVSDIELCKISELHKLLNNLQLLNAKKDEEKIQFLSFNGHQSQYTGKHSG